MLLSRYPMQAQAAPTLGHLYEVFAGGYMMVCAQCGYPARSPHQWILRLWLDVHLRKCKRKT